MNTTSPSASNPPPASPLSPGRRLLITLVTEHPVRALCVYGILLAAACLWPFNFWQPNQAHLVPGGGLRFTPPSIAFTSSPPAKLARLSQFSLFVKISPGQGTQRYPIGHVLSYGLDARRYNFFLEHRQDSLMFNVCYAYQGQPWPYTLVFPLPNQAEAKDWIAITYDGMILRAFVNGRLDTQETCGHLDLSVWKDSYPLVLGSDPTGRLLWNGEIDSLVILDHPISPEEIGHLPVFIAASSPVLVYSFTGGDGRRIPDHSTITGIDVLIPERFRPWTRLVLRSPADDSIKWVDILLNILGFVPLGFIIACYGCRKGTPTGKGLRFALITGLLISLVLEILQAYLPTRDSSMTDVISNTLGVLPGYYLRIVQSAKQSAPSNLERG